MFNLRSIPSWLFLSVLLSVGRSADAGPTVDAAVRNIDLDRGIVAVLGLPGGDAGFVTGLAEARELRVYFQSADADQVAAVRKAADAAGLLGNRIFVDSGSLETIGLSDNVADAIVVAPSATKQTVDQELLRALRPRGTAFLADRKLVKPVPKGADDWSHPYHGPDNNPQSDDQLVRGRFRTQFLAEPKFSPMPEQTVVAGGRIYKAMGHIAHKANQNEMLNTLLCINAYNGTILWKRSLPKGFMIHRNTMVATDDALYMGDLESCKVFDGRTGKLRREITVADDISDGPAWKWMAIRDGVLFAMVGHDEVKVDTQRSARRGLGHWPWGMWKGHDYIDAKTAFGFGRTLVAIDLKTGKRLWHHREKAYLDSRALCMKGDRIYCYSPGTFLKAIDADSGKVVWKNADKELIEAIGPNEKAQHYVTGYATSCYMKCNDEYLLFAGPQRSRMVAASTKDGRLAWTHPVGNLQLVLREDAIYAAGPQKSAGGAKLEYSTGSVLADFPARRACTRATGCADSIFYRAPGGTTRVMTDTNQAVHIAPMRPPCQDGVIVSNGHLYWGPWMCGCQLSLYGHIALAPAGSAVSASDNLDDIEQRSLTVHANNAEVRPLAVRPGDWVSYRGDNAHSDGSGVEAPGEVELAWEAEVTTGELPTAPVAAGGFVFLADRAGVVRALDSEGKQVWKSYVAGPVYYPPAVAHDRLFVGSADGRVHAFEARTGRPLWTFRVAPDSKRIPVYGKLVSRWPVAGGVVVENDTVYAAAGITHYDGTYVVALDALTGKLKARNDRSGTLSEEVDSGVSMQGELRIVDGELRFLGGGVYEIARFDLDTLDCLNKPLEQVRSQYRTAFYPWYPAYGKYVSLEHACGDGNLLCHDASYEGSNFGNLALQQPLTDEESKKLVKDAAREFLRRRGRNVPKPTNVWRDERDRRFTGFIVSGDTLLATGHPDEKPEESFLAAIDVKSGSDAWNHPLPAVAVKGGIAIDATGRLFVSLENGRLLCFAPTAK